MADAFGQFTLTEESFSLAHLVRISFQLTNDIQHLVATAHLIVLDGLKLDAIKTKEFKKVLDALKIEKALVVLDSLDRNVILSARNIPGVATCQANSINTYDIMKYSTVVATKAAVEKIQEVYA